MKLHHVGIAVESLDEAIPIFEKLLGSPPLCDEVVKGQRVRVATFELGGSRIELLEATEAESPIARFIGKRGPGIHHLALAVPNLAGKLAELEKSGLHLLDRTPRPGADEEQVAFLKPKSTSGVLIELVEEK